MYSGRTIKFHIGRLAGVNVFLPGDKIPYQAFGAVDSADGKATKCRVTGEVASEQTAY